MAWKNNKANKGQSPGEKPKGDFFESRERTSEELCQLIMENQAPWQKPWLAGETAMPYNPVTKTVYRGYNRLVLSMCGYFDPRWVSFLQAQRKGWRIKAGSKAKSIEFWQWSSQRRVIDQSGNPVRDAVGNPVLCEVNSQRPWFKRFHVFNATQVTLQDGSPIPGAEPLPVPWVPEEALEALIEASGATIKYDQGYRCMYNVNDDAISMPRKGQFPTAGSFYSCLLHELAHWTRHPSRLNRDKRAGGSTYAQEELRAEISSWMLCQDLGLDFCPDNSLAYCQHWVKALSDDPSEIARACAEAERIKDFLMAKVPGLKYRPVAGDGDEGNEGDSQGAQPPAGQPWPSLPSPDGEGVEAINELAIRHWNRPRLTDNQSRKALKDWTGLTRRQLAGPFKATKAERAEGQGTGPGHDPTEPVFVDVPIPSWPAREEVPQEGQEAKGAHETPMSDLEASREGESAEGRASNGPLLLEGQGERLGPIAGEEALGPGNPAPGPLATGAQDAWPQDVWPMVAGPQNGGSPNGVSHDGDQVVIIPLPPESLAPDGDGDRLAWEAEREGAHVFGLLMDGLPMETVAQLLAFGDLDPSIAREYLAMVAEGVETAAARASEGLSPGEEEKAMALAEKAREALRKAAGRDKGAQPAGARESQGSPAPQKGQGEARFGELRLDALNRVALCLCRPGLAMSGSARWETARDICVNSLGTLWANEGKFTRFLREAKRVCEGQILLRQGQGALCQAGWERLEVSVHNALLLVVDAGRQLGYPGYLFPSGLAGESPYAHVPLAPKREGDAPGRVLTLAGIGQREFRVAGEGEAPRGYGVLREGSDELIALFRGEGNAADFAWSLCRPDTPMLRQFQDEEFEAQFRGRLPVAEAIQWDSLPIDIDQPDLSPWYHPDGSPKGFGDVLDWPPTLGPTEPGPGNGRDGQGSIRPRQ